MGWDSCIAKVSEIIEPGTSGWGWMFSSCTRCVWSICWCVGVTSESVISSSGPGKDALFTVFFCQVSQILACQRCVFIEQRVFFSPLHVFFSTFFCQDSVLISSFPVFRQFSFSICGRGHICLSVICSAVVHAVCVSCHMCRWPQSGLFQWNTCLCSILTFTLPCYLSML